MHFTRSALPWYKKHKKTRKKELLKKYGSLKKIREASLTSLEEILPKDVAENLYNILRNEEEEWIKRVLQWLN